MANAIDYHLEPTYLEQLAKQYGMPLFVYNTDIIKRQYDRMENCLKKVKQVKINYACKALTNINILKYIRSLGAGLDAVSFQEIKLGLRAGFEASDIIYTPNSVSIEEMEAALELGEDQY